MNALEEGSAINVFRSWDRRLERPTRPLASNEDDPELLVHVPFTGNVKIKAVTVIGGSDETAPSSLRVFVNREDLDFAAVADLPPVQAWDLQENNRGDIEYPTQCAPNTGHVCKDMHSSWKSGAVQYAAAYNSGSWIQIE